MVSKTKQKEEFDIFWNEDGQHMSFWDKMLGAKKPSDYKEFLSQPEHWWRYQEWRRSRNTSEKRTDGPK